MLHHLCHVPTMGPLQTQPKVHQESYLENVVTLETPKEKLEELLVTIVGGKTKRENGA